MLAQRATGRVSSALMILARGGAARSRGLDKPPRSHHSSPSTTSAWSSAAFIFRGMRGFTNDAVKDGSPALSRGPQFSDYESGGRRFESFRARHGSHGVSHVRKKVPKRVEQPTPGVFGHDNS